MKCCSRQSGPGSIGLTLRAPSRRGVVILEFILALPLLIILLLAVIEFTLIYQMNQQVAYASKFGAKLASEVSRRLADNPRLSNFNVAGGPPAGESLKERVDEYLQTQQLTASCSVVLRHTACSIPNTLQENPGSIPSSCNCGTPPSPQPVPSEPNPADVAYVQVTVAVKLAGNVPDLLNSFGFKLEDRTCIQTTTMRLEPDNTPPIPRISISSGTVPPGYSPSVPTGSQSCGSTLNFSNSSNPNLNTGSIVINFDGSGSTDAEQASGLSYSWTATGGATVTPPGVNSTSTVTFPVPPDPNTDIGMMMTTQPPSVANYTVTLTVTDGCGHSDSCTVNVHIETYDSNPGP